MNIKSLLSYDIMKNAHTHCFYFQTKNISANCEFNQSVEHLLCISK